MWERKPVIVALTPPPALWFQSHREAQLVAEIVDGTVKKLEATTRVTPGEKPPLVRTHLLPPLAVVLVILSMFCVCAFVVCISKGGHGCFHEHSSLHTSVVWAATSITVMCL